MAEMVEHPHIKARGMVRRHDGADPFFEVLYPAWVDGKPPEDRAPVRYREAAEVIAEWARE
jgi:crotonobetainyl-CoA:carnitine CoA-transferase CaiB-like acyl-CoA transferase